MSNIHQSILEKLIALNIDIYHYDEIVRCYALTKLNIKHSRAADDPTVYRSVTHTEKTNITLEGKIFGDHSSIYTMISETLKGKPYIVSLAYARHLTEIMQSIHESADNNKLVLL